MANTDIGSQNIHLFNREYFDFIADHSSQDTVKLKLKYSSGNLNFSIDSALLQIDLRKKCRKKLATFINNPFFIFPDRISSEQSTDESVASYHVYLAQNASTVIDMTTGLGIDAISMAREGKEVTAIEINKEKFEALNHNIRLFQLDNINPINTDSIEYASSLEKKYDLLFIDPVRRDSNNRRTYSFNDCVPNVVVNQKLLFNTAKRILIKASPLLDLSHILKELSNVKQLHIVDKDNECKEILVELQADSDFQGVKVVNVIELDKFIITSFTPDELNNRKAQIIDKEDLKKAGYLYEPQPGLMKLNAYGAICDKFSGLKRLSPNTSLYASEILYKDFPGRVLKICNFLQKGDLKKLKGEQLNVVAKNYPLSADQLRKKYDIIEGQDRFLYGARVSESETPIHIICERYKTMK